MNAMSEQSSKSLLASIREYAEALLCAGALALIIRAFFMQAFTIPSGSMLDTILIGDYVLVNKMSYGVKIPFTDTYMFRTGEPEHGDIIVFKYPRDTKVDYIKRVVGVPGDVLEMRNEKFYRNGQLVQEDYAHYTTPFSRYDNFGP